METQPLPAYSENPHWVAVRKKKELMRAVWVATSTGPSLPAMNATVCAGEWVDGWVNGWVNAMLAGQF